MSTQPPVTQEDIRALCARLLEEEEYFDRLGQLPEAEAAIYEEVSPAHATLMRSVGLQPGAVRAETIHEGAVDIVYQKLQRYACDYIKAAYLMLQELGVSDEAKEFVIIMLGVSGGNSKKKLIVTDERLAEMTGYSRKTLGLKRRAYREWEARAGWTVVKIHERPRDKETHQFYPTEYEVLFADHVTQFLREWRTFYQQRLNQPIAKDAGEEEPAHLWDDLREQRKETAFAEATSAEVRHSIAEKVIGDRMEMSPIPPRKSFNISDRPPRPKLDQINAQILDLIARGRDEARRTGK